MTWWQTIIVLMAALWLLGFLRNSLKSLKARIKPVEFKFTDLTLERIKQRIDFLRIAGKHGASLYIVDRETGRFVKFYKKVKSKDESSLQFSFPVADWSEDYVDRVKDYFESNNIEYKSEPPRSWKDLRMNAKGLITASCGSGWELQGRMAKDVFEIMGYGAEDVFGGFIHGRVSNISQTLGWPSSQSAKQ